MKTETPQLQEPAVTLPATAPQVRITAGLGSAGQKTWNLRRPVTLVGSGRPAHIVLHDREIAKAHCLIVNTGTEVLIKDLHTQSGTFTNRNRVDLAVLTDGDVVTVGQMSMQVAIQLPEDASNDSNCGIQFVDPVKFAKPVGLRLIHTDTCWNVEDAVVLIGRLDEANVRLDHDDVSSRHAVLFRFGGEPAVFDLGSRAGIWVNGKRTSLSPLADGDCLTVGPFGLSVACAERSAADGSAPTSPLGDPAARIAGPDLNGPPISNQEEHASRNGQASLSHSSATATVGQEGAGRTMPHCGTINEPAHPSDILKGTNGSPLGGKLEQVWDKLNAWDPQADSERAAKAQIEADLTARVAQLEARDAALRGQLHDITRFHEQILERERELAHTMAEVQAARDALGESLKAFADKEAELVQQGADLQRRENVLTQRWTRIRSATCPHCGNPTNLGNLLGGDA